MYVYHEQRTPKHTNVQEHAEAKKKALKPPCENGYPPGMARLRMHRHEYRQGRRRRPAPPSPISLPALLLHAPHILYEGGGVQNSKGLRHRSRQKLSPEMDVRPPNGDGPTRKMEGTLHGPPRLAPLLPGERPLPRANNLPQPRQRRQSQKVC